MTVTKSKSSNIVISGLAGRFPQSDNPEQLWENLINGNILYQPDTFNYPKIFTKTPKSRGALKDISTFDNSFFGYDSRSANCLDPQLRILLEVIYESLWDAGIAPESWSGSRTGFYLGSSFEETGITLRSLDSSVDLGQHFSSRVSHHFNWKGPSMTVDTACASSLNALTEAYYGLMSGTCDQAIVAGICIHVKPSVTICFGELEMLSKSGKSKCLDETADGYIRSEAITVVVLQKKSNANRVYGHILGMATSSDGYTKEGITYPCRAVQTSTMKLALKRSGVDPLDVDYVEGHVTGTTVGDPIETSAIIQAYRGTNAYKPLILGCLKGNIGHTEASAGLCALIKSLKIFQHSLIPMNVGMNNPNPRIDSLREGQLITPRVNRPWNGSIIGIDAFGFGGANTHCLISAPDKRSPVMVESPKPDRRLICLCNRNQTGLKGMIEFIQSIDYLSLNECLTLIDSIAVGTTIKSGMDWRGYLIVSNISKSLTIVNQETSQSTNLSPIVLVFDHDYSSINSYTDYETINNYLATSINSCYDHCKSNGFDKKMINNDPAISLIIYQLSWVNLLIYQCQIKPKLIVGSSFGSIAASYAAKQITWTDCLKSLINFIQLRLKKSSSPIENSNLQQQLESQLTSSINLNEIINRYQKDPNIYIHLTADDNKLIGDNLSDHILLNVSTSITSLCNGQGSVVDQQRKPFMINDTLTILGKLYLAGHNPDIRVLSSSRQLPVSGNCPSLGHLIKWNHEFNFDTIVYPDFFRDSFHTVHRIDLMDPEYSDLAGYSVEGQTICPISCYIWVIWDHLVKLRSTDQRHRYNSFEINNLTVHKLIDVSEPIELRVVSNPDNGEFSIKLASDYTPIVTGWAKIQVFNKKTQNLFDYSSYLEKDEIISDEKTSSESDIITLTSEDVYFDLSIRGWRSSDSFKNITTYRSDDSQVTIKFTNNWITFFESILITPLLLDTNDSLMGIPMKLAYFRCDPLVLNEGLKIQRKSGTLDTIGFTFNLDQQSSTIVTSGLISQFPDYQILPFDLISPELHYRHQDFLPLTSELQLNDKTISSMSKLIETINSTFTENTNNQINSESKLINLLESIVKSSDVKSTLKQSVDQLDCYFESEIISNICSDLMTINLGLFEENCSPTGLLTINQIGRINGLSYDINCDQTFRKIRNRYKYNLTDDYDSISSADLIIYNHSSMGLTRSNNLSIDDNQQLLSNCKSLKSSSFLLILTRENNFTFEKTINQLIDNNKCQPSSSGKSLQDEIRSTSDLIVISNHTITFENVTINSILLKKLSTTINSQPTVIYTTGRTYDWIDQLKSKLNCNQNEIENKIWLIHNESYRSGLIGLALALKEETFGHRIRAILAPGFDHKKDEKIFKQLQKTDLLINVQVNHDWGTYRHIELNPNDQVIVKDQSAYLAWTSTDRSQLSWFKHTPIVNNNQTISNYFSTINQCISRLSTHDDNLNLKIGWDFAGYTDEGKKVIGLCYGNGTNFILSNDLIVIKFNIPDHLSLQSSVTLPVPYLIAYYCLNILGAIKSNDSRILITGIYDDLIDFALISICLSLNCKIYIHISPSPLSKLIVDNYCKFFPSLNDSNFIITSYHYLDKYLLQSTNNYGVDLAINMKSTNNIQLISNCLAFGGKLIHIGSFDDHLNTHYLSDQFTSKCASFESFEPINLFRKLMSESWIKTKLVNLINHGFANNQIKPLPFVTTRRDQVTIKCDQLRGTEVKQFRQVITIRDEITANPIIVNCITRTQFNPDKCYILIGGLGGIGLQLTRWMVKRGAKNIIIISRKGFTNQYQRFIVNRLKSRQFNCINTNSSINNVNIVVIKTPTSDYHSFAKIIAKSIANYGPVGGIFNLAGILKSGLFESQDASTFNEVCYSKIEITEHFDKLSRLHCPELDYFVCFSSISALGILGEPNYGYANSYMERLCEDRRSIGLPGLAIQWGAIGDVGMAQHLTTSIAGSAFRRVLGVINDLDKFLQLPFPVCYSVQHATKQEPIASGKDNILQRIGHILGCQSLEKLDGVTTLGDLGLDSLQAIEVKTLIDTTCNINLSNIAILKLSISQLGKMASEALNSKLNMAVTDTQTGTTDGGKAMSVEEPILVNLTDKGTEPVFFFPPAFFDFLSMMPVAHTLNRTVVGVQLTDYVRSLGTFDAISKFYAETILSAYPNLTRYDFVGYSFGCTVSFELAKVLQKMIGKPSIDRIVFIDASPYGLKRLGQKTMKMLLAGFPVWEIFIATMEFMGVKIDEKTKRSLEEAEDDEIMYKEIVSQVLVNAGMNGPTDSLLENTAGLIDRTYYLTSMSDLGFFDGDALFVQVINKAISSSGTSSLVNEGLTKIIKGSLKTVMFNATHFDILKVYAREVAAEIEKIMP